MRYSTEGHLMELEKQLETTGHTTPVEDFDRKWRERIRKAEEYLDSYKPCPYNRRFEQFDL